MLVSIPCFRFLRTFLFISFFILPLHTRLSLFLSFPRFLSFFLFLFLFLFLFISFCSYFISFLFGLVGSYSEDSDSWISINFMFFFSHYFYLQMLISIPCFRFLRAFLFFLSSSFLSKLPSRSSYPFLAFSLCCSSCYYSVLLVLFAFPSFFFPCPFFHYSFLKIRSV